MPLLSLSSPHTHRQDLDTGQVMRQVIYACMPGLLVLTVFFGWGSAVNVLLCGSFCMLFEAAAIKARNRHVPFFLKDCSALLTGVLLGLSLPPFAPWWLVACGAFFAIVVAKQLYGGLGANPFNPAMVGYVVLLISFPVDMTRWITPGGISDGPSLIEGLRQVFTSFRLTEVDGLTGATPLDVLKQRDGSTIAELYASEPVLTAGRWAGHGWEWVNIAFLGGGAYLLYRKIFTWHAPVAMLLALAVMSALFYDGGSSASGGSPLFHVLSGAAMFGAFFIVTDPVSSAVSNRGRLIYGAAIGVLVYLIRAWGHYPDAVAFAVLLMNFAAAFIDYYTLPRAYGHKRAGNARRRRS